MTSLRPALALALCAAACDYHLDRLSARDGGPVLDRPTPPADQGVRPDVVAPADVPGDLGSAPTDAGAARVGVCALDGGAAVALPPPVTPVRPGSDAGATLAFAMVTGNLQGAPMVALPTGTLDGGAVLVGCAAADRMRTPPTRVYRYQVAEGGTVTATTNTQHCTAFDTRVYALWSCGAADLASPLACDDDISDGTDTSRCATCGAADGGVACPSRLSTLTTPVTQAARRGDVLYFAVTGYEISPGVFPHRLWVGENAARIEAFPTEPPAPPVNRCVCQEATQGARSVYFPYRGDGGNFPATLSAVGESTSFLGVRDTLPQGVYSGVALQLRVLRWALSPAAGCPRADVRAVFDLLVGGATVTSFSIPATLQPPVTVTVPYTAFAPTTLTRIPAGMPIELRLREVQPQAACLTIDVDPTAGASAITLYGG